LRLAGLLPIPAQAWKTKHAAAITGQSATKPAVGSAPANRDQISSIDATQVQAQRGCSVARICSLGSKGDNVEANVEAEGQNVADNEKMTEFDEDEEDVVIRRVGFVFLAYNVEYWQVSLQLLPISSMCKIVRTYPLPCCAGTGSPSKCFESKFFTGPTVPSCAIPYVWLPYSMLQTV
jgi:hypothetical protein